MNKTEQTTINNKLGSLVGDLRTKESKLEVQTTEPSFAEAVKNGKKKTKNSKSHKEVITEQAKAISECNMGVITSDLINNPIKTAEKSGTHEMGDEGYKMVNSRRKKISKTIVGTIVSSETSCFGAPLPSRYFVIERVLPQNTEENIKEYLVKKNLDVRSVSLLSAPNMKYKKFVIEVSKNDIDQIYNEQIWPQGVHVRKFFGFYTPKDSTKKQQFNTESSESQNILKE